MKTRVNVLKEALEQELKAAEAAAEQVIAHAQQRVAISKRYLKALKQLVEEEGFEDVQAEIHFFKTDKPDFEKYVIYYNRICHIESNKPPGVGTALKEYLHQELRRLESHHQDHRDFYAYYKSGASSFDEVLFTRAHQDEIMPSEYSSSMDTSFSTTHSYLLARLLADELLAAYISSELHRLEQPPVQPPVPNKAETGVPLPWLATKVAFVEMCYRALYPATEAS